MTATPDPPLRSHSSFRRGHARAAVGAGIVGLILAGLLILPGNGYGKEEAKIYALEPADTSSPRATLRSFINACNEIYELLQQEEKGIVPRNEASHKPIVNRIFRCLDLSKEAGFLREHSAGEAAVTLKEVLDRLDLPPEHEIPGAEEIEAAAADGRTIDRWRVPNTEIVIARISEGIREGDYVFGSDTVARAPEFFRLTRDWPYKKQASKKIYEWYLSDPGPRVAPFVNLLPDTLRTHFWGQHALWQWIGLFLSLALALGVMALAYWWARRRAQNFKEQHNLFRYCLTLAFPIAAMLVPWWLGRFVRNELRFSGNLLATIIFTTSVIFLLAAMFVIVAAGSRIAAIIIASPKIHPKGLDAQLIRIVCRVLSLIAAVIVFLEGGKYLGIPLTTLLASAGVGGLALALAAQDSLKNFFGSMMIILDKPFRIGERIVVKGYDGIVEEIGLRSTKIRLLTGHQVSIPNEEMARSDIENIGRRPHIRRLTDLRLPSGTPSAKVERAVAAVREIVKDHEGMVEQHPPRVSVNDFNADSINIRFIYWYHPPNYWDFLAQSEKINFRIQRAFEDIGVEFAQPDLRLYLDPKESAAAALSASSETLGQGEQSENAGNQAI